MTTTIEIPVRPRLLVLSSTYPRWKDDPEPGFVHELTRRLARHFEVHVLCPHAPGAKREERLDGIAIQRFRYAPTSLETLVQNGGITSNLKHHPGKWFLAPLFLAAQTLATWRALKRLRPDCIHAHWIIPQGLILWMVDRWRQPAIPYLLTSHGGDLFGLRGVLLEKLKRAVIKRAAAMTVVSTAMLPEAQRLGAASGRLQVIPMGVDFAERFTPGPPATRYSGEILFVGRLVEKKGLCHLIAAMPAIISHVPHARLKIVGTGPEQPALRELAERLKVAARIEFIPALPQAQLPELYRQANVCVAPFIEASSGDREGLGLVTVEAIACGCPVIVGDMPVLNDIFEQQDGDLRVDPKHTEELTRRIVTILSDPEAAYQRILATRERLKARYDWSSVTERYQACLLSLSRANGRRTHCRKTAG